MSYGQRPFGLRDVKLVSIGGTPTQVDLPAARTLSFNERVKSGELSGDDKTIAVVAFSDAIEWEMEAGGISLERAVPSVFIAFSILGNRSSEIDCRQYE